jgi:hypothetical protein
VAECQGPSRDKIARYLGVGKTAIDRAEAVVDAAEEDPEEYGYLVEQMDRSGKVAGAFRRLEVLRQAKELDAAAPELPAGPFRVIVADPPWRYESGNSLPYPTMDIEEIKAISDGLQIVAEQIAQAEALLLGEVLLPFEQQPARLLQDGGAPLAAHAARFLGTDLVERLVHFRYDVEAVEDVQSFGAFFPDGFR